MAIGDVGRAEASFPAVPSEVVLMVEELPMRKPMPDSSRPGTWCDDRRPLEATAVSSCEGV